MNLAVGSGHPVADCSQTCGRGCVRKDGLLGTVATSTRLWSYQEHRFLAPSELIAAHGFREYDFQQVSWEQAMSVIGNMQVATQLAYALIPVLEATGHLTKVQA